MCGPEPGAGAPPIPRNVSGEAHCDRATLAMKTRANLALRYPLARGTMPPLVDRRHPDIEGPLYTVIAYLIPAGAHCVETLVAESATDAALRLRRKLECERGELEIVAVIWGRANFEPVDASQVALAPHCAVIEAE